MFGTGKTLEIGYESEIDRDQALLGYSDGNVFGSRVQLTALFANASDGHRRELRVERPFFSLDTRWSLGGTVHDEERVDTMYDLGEEIDEFGHDIDAFGVQGGWSRGLDRGSTRSAGWSASRRRSTRSARRSTSRSRCCCRPTASSCIRGSAGNGSRTTIAR